MFVKRFIYKTGSMVKMMISCKEATAYILKKEEHRLGFKQRVQLWIHLAICSFCKLFMKQSRILSEAAKHLPEDNTASLSESDRKAILESLEKLQ